MKYAAHVRLHRPGRRGPVDGRALNLSPSGVLIEATEPVDVGMEVFCDIPLPGGQRRLKGTVARLERLSPERVGVGIRFTELAPADETLLAELVKAGNTSRVVQVRFEGMRDPLKSKAILTEDGIRLSTALPFLRLESTVDVTFLAGDSRIDSQGVLREVRLDPTSKDGVPRLAVDVTLRDGPPAQAPAPVPVAPAAVAIPTTPAPTAPRPSVRRRVNVRGRPRRPTPADLDPPLTTPPPTPTPEPAPLSWFGQGEARDGSSASPRDGRARALGVAALATGVAALALLALRDRDHDRPALPAPVVQEAPAREPVVPAPSAPGPAAPHAGTAPQAPGPATAATDPESPGGPGAAAGGTAPAARTAPAAGTAPVPGTAPAAGTTPAPGTAPIAGAAPAAGSAPVAGTAPAAPAPPSAPAVAAAPGSGVGAGGPTPSAAQEAANPAVRTPPVTIPRPFPPGTPGPEVQSDGELGTAVVPVSGSTAGMFHYSLGNPRGLAVNLPYARSELPLGLHQIGRDGYRFIWIREREQGGIQIRYIFTHPAPDEQLLELEENAVRVQVRLRPDPRG